MLERGEDNIHLNTTQQENREHIQGLNAVHPRPTPPLTHCPDRLLPPPCLLTRGTVNRFVR